MPGKSTMEITIQEGLTMTGHERINTRTTMNSKLQLI